MRAILIDAFNQRMEEVDLPEEMNAFTKEVRKLLRTETLEIIHSNELLTIFYDGASFTKKIDPAFWTTLMEDSPFFGNVLCVGRNPVTKEYEDLYHEYQFSNFQVRWCTPEEIPKYRQKAIEIARKNLS